MNKLEEYRVKVHGWSQRELARRSGISPVTICKIENGGPSRYSTKAKLAGALDVPVSAIFPDEAITIRRRNMLDRWKRHCEKLEYKEETKKKIYSIGIEFIKGLYK